MVTFQKQIYLKKPIKYVPEFECRRLGADSIKNLIQFKFCFISYEIIKYHFAFR